jgi:teichuronic acid biosynthesis glycosyltransferase TuaH
MKVAVISIEPWDQVWRRNQHLAFQLVEQGLAEKLLFVEPPVPSISPKPGRPHPLIWTVAPTLRIPKRIGGLAQVAKELVSPLSRADVLWINEPTLGSRCIQGQHRVVYDVTDDWRTFDFPQRIHRRLVSAEDHLARTATTIVCSEVLESRWRDRYGVDAHLVKNGVDLEHWRDAQTMTLCGRRPHIGYLGTLHDQRLDVDLVVDIARDTRTGTVHLVGPDALSAHTRLRLMSLSNVRIHGPVPARDLPSWGKAMDILVCPHRVNDFTMSLDAIKAYEYLASGRPVVATPTSGFQHLVGVVDVAESSTFVDRIFHVEPPSGDTCCLPDWGMRAREFAAVLGLLQPPESGLPQPPQVRNHLASQIAVS